jgi:cyclomaltodextrinase / maltogenic alpha-amylase / neopullulanase
MIVRCLIEENPPMQKSANESVSLAASRALRGGDLPHVPPPASPVSTTLRLDLQAPPGSDPEIFFVDPKREDPWQVAMQPGETPDQWSAEILTPHEPTLLYYHFRLKDGTTLRERRQAEGQEKALIRDPRPVGSTEWKLGAGRSRERVPETLVEKAVYGVWKEQDFRIAVYQPEGAPPEWVRGQVFYQIVPDRFARSGDTPRRERTYRHQALHLGWDELPERPPKGRDFYGGNLRGVIERLDYLADLGVTTIYFTPIFSSPSNHRYDAIDYYQIDPQLGTLEDFTELLEQARARGLRVLMDGVFNHCSSESIYFKEAQADRRSPYYRWFHFTNWPENYLGWMGVRSMPEFIECPEVEAFFFGNQGVALQWLRFGTSGWRTDVTPWLSGDFWRRFRQAVRHEFPEAFLIAEDWADATQRLLGDSFDSTMNYRFGYSLLGWAGGKLNALELDDRLETLRRDTPPTHQHTLLNLIDSHDTARAFTLLNRDRARLKLAVMLQFAYPGVPMLYSGDETSQEGDYAEDSRRSFPWDNIDEDMHAFYKHVIKTRIASPALSFGEVKTLWIDEGGAGYAILRRYEENCVVAVFNNSTRPVHALIPTGDLPGGVWHDHLNNLPDALIEAGMLNVELPPLTGGWYSEL